MVIFGSIVKQNYISANEGFNKVSSVSNEPIISHEGQEQVANNLYI
jgi:hypothetical protein